MIQQDLTSRIEEADMCIIPHVNQTVNRRSNNVVILSNDTDVVVLVLHYMEKIVSEGLQKHWSRYEQKIIPDTSQFILCIRTWVQMFALYF